MSQEERKKEEMNVWARVYAASISNGQPSIEAANDAGMAVVCFDAFFFPSQSNQSNQ